MTQAILVLINGFEEIEALTTVDILRRGQVDLKTASLTGDLKVIGSHDIPVIADVLFEDADFSEVDMVIIPGGTVAFDAHEGLKKKVLECAQADKYIAAICAAPMVLGGIGLLEGRRATCYPGFEHYLKGATLQEGAPVVVDGKIVTGRGPGLAQPFALQLLELIKGSEVRNEVAKGLLIE